MKELTDETIQRIQSGWRVGVEKKEGLLIYEIVSRIGDTMRGDETWLIHRKSEGKRGGRGIPDAQQFVPVETRNISYACLLSEGTIYLKKELAGKYDI